MVMQVSLLEANDGQSPSTGSAHNGNRPPASLAERPKKQLLLTICLIIL